MRGKETIFTLSKTQRLVLDAIRQSGQLPRARLAEICNVSAPAITKTAKSLLEKELIIPSGKGRNLRGQPSQNLTINPEGAYSLGIFIERDALSFNIVNFKSNVVFSDRVSGQFSEPHNSITILFEKLDLILSRHSKIQNRLLGIGLAVTGNFVTDRHTVVPPDDMSSWSGIDFDTVFRSRYKIPVVVENDGAAAAMGELFSGLGTKYSTFFYIHLGNGLGGGYIFQNRLIRGAHGNSSEIGHLLRFPKCRPTLKNLSEELNRPLGDISYQEIEELFSRGDERFFDWLNQSIKNLTGPVNAIAVLLDPQAIIFGGRFPPCVIEYVIERASIEEYELGWHEVPRPKLEMALKPSADAAVLGAASLPIYNLLNDEQ